MAQPTTLYKYFTGKGEKLPSVSERGRMFNLGSGYAGTKEQNIALLANLLGGSGTTRTRMPTKPSTQETSSVSVGGGGGFVAGMPSHVTDRYGNKVDLRATISRVSQKYGIPTGILSAQLKQESGFNPNAGSVAGAMGIAQFIRSTAKAYGLDPWNVEDSIEAQARLMSDNLKQYGSIERALSAYNSGNPSRYQDPTFKTHYGSVGETYKYVRSIQAMAKKVAPGEVPVYDKRKEGIGKQLKGIIDEVMKGSPAPSPSAQLQPSKQVLSPGIKRNLGYGIFPMPPLREDIDKTINVA